MGTRTVKVVDKIASFSGDALICNNEYDFVFDFDDEWDGHEKKIARFIANGIAEDVEIDNNTCKSPKFTKATSASVGVFVEGVIATTEAAIPCKRSILCNGANKEPEYNGEYELLVPTVSGVWVFNEKVTLSNEVISQDVTFIYNADGDVATSIIVDSSSVNFDSLRVYDDGFAEVYRTVDFGTEPQEVSEEFYAWLTANAVKQ